MTSVPLTHRAAPAGASAPGLLARLLTPKGELIAAILAGVLLLPGYILHVVLHVHWGVWLVWASLAIGMFHGGRAALASLRDRRVDIDVLMIVGAALAAYIGHPGEGALLLFLFVLSGALEDLAMKRTTREVEALHQLMPTGALAWRPGAGGGEWLEVEAETLAPGDRVKIRPGERVPADARVVLGESSMDQSAMTGESMPRPVRVGDELFAGTINTDDPLEAIVLRPVSESSIQRILNLVTSARAQREPIQRFIDRLSQPYAVGVMLAGVLIALVWRLALQRPWDDAITTAITFLIVCSPCALVIATPTGTLTAIARGARGGVLFKGGQSIDQLASTGAVAFDKTGTLTFGRPRLYEAHPVAWSDGRELLALAAGLEEDSTHPIARAVREAAALRDIDPIALVRVNHTTGQGISGTHNALEVRLGRYEFAEPLIPICFRARVRDVLGKVRERGHVAVVVAKGAPAPLDPTHDDARGEVAILIMADAVRPGAKALVEQLHALSVRPVRMLTGDNLQTARRVAESLNLDAVDAELLPHDKLDLVASMKRDLATNNARYRGVAVIGDGVNDAPALAAADVAVAIGAIGSAAALETADIVLLSDDLSSVPWAVRLARHSRKVVKANLIFAVSVIALMAIATLVGSLIGRPVPMAVGVLAHEGGTLLVVLNSLLLLRFPSASTGSPPHPGHTPHEPPENRV